MFHRITIRTYGDIATKICKKFAMERPNPLFASPSSYAGKNASHAMIITKVFVK
jgi:hypothetical protein